MEFERKDRLRRLNHQIWEDPEASLPPSVASLDSSLKKNTAFIKRLRTSINQPSLPSFIQDIQLLSIQKYLSEVIAAICEGCLKLKSADEYAVACEVASALHQRFGPDDFTKPFAAALYRGLGGERPVSRQSAVEHKDEKERVSRQRILLRLITDLWLVGVVRSLEEVIPTEDGPVIRAAKLLAATSRASPRKTNGVQTRVTNDEPFPLSILKSLLDPDRVFANLAIAVFFARNYAADVLGLSDVESQLPLDGCNEGSDGLSDGTQDPQPRSSVPSAMQQRFRSVLTGYFGRLYHAIVRGQAALSEQVRRNAEIAVRAGQIFEDRQEHYEKQVKEQERLVSNSQALSQVLGLPMPNLTRSDEVDLGDIAIGLVKKGEYRTKGEGPGIWEDEDERRFYENLIDLRERVPAILLEEPKKKSADGEAQVGTRSKSTQSVGAGARQDAEEELPAVQTGLPGSENDVDPQNAAIINRETGSQVNTVIARLTELGTREAVDQLAIDFTFLNTKASRNRLLKALQDVPKGRVDLLPLYARLSTTLGRYMTDILEGMIAHLHTEFRNLQRRKEKEYLNQVRTMNVRYLAELIKFGSVPDHVTFHCLKVSLDDFSRMNIELISMLMENCGRYLLRNADTAARTSAFLETLHRKKSSLQLGQQERMLIENTIYFVNPPEHAAIEQKERSPMELFVHKLIYEDMNGENVERMVKLLRKLHWEEAEVSTMLIKVLTRPWKLNFSDVRLLAVVTFLLKRHHTDIGIQVIDETMEQIIAGLELNHFAHNQRRIAQVRYLGELYVYRALDSTLIFDVLNRLITFGHLNGLPQADAPSELDAPDDFFRIQLVCYMLQSCGKCFSTGAARVRLDKYIILFQYYILTKDPLPIDVEYLVNDVIGSLRTSWKMPVSLEDATATLRAHFNEDGQRPTSSRSETEDAQNSPDTSSSDGEGEESSRSAVHPRHIQAPTEDQTDHAGDTDDADEEHLVVRREVPVQDPEEEAAFDRELAALMAPSAEPRKVERRQIFDEPLPAKKKSATSTNTATMGSGSDSDSGRGTPPNTVAFSLMTKKGNRQQTRSIELPSDSAFAVAMRDRQTAQKAEQQRIKNLVLNYDLG